MTFRRSAPRLARLCVPLVLAAPLLMTAPAFAAGNLTVQSKEMTEESGGWRLLVTIKAAHKPVTPHVPYRFIFTPMAVYETYIDDSSPNEKTRSVAQGRDVQPNIESLDVDFSNGRGVIYDTTKFDFVIKRSRGYYAGEYQLEVRDDNNNMVGKPVTLKFSGKNDVIDRRAMIMTGSGGAKKPAPSDASGGAGAPAAGDKGAAGDATPAATPPATDAGAEPPPEVEKKSGGCGCELPGGSSPGGALGVVVVGVVSAGAKRRRR